MPRSGIPLLGWMLLFARLACFLKGALRSWTAAPLAGQTFARLAVLEVPWAPQAVQSTSLKAAAPSSPNSAAWSW